MGVAISGMPAATVLNGTDLFEIEQSGVSKKLTKTQLAALLLPAPAIFSGLPAVTVLNDADLFVVEQGSVVSKLTKLQFVTLVGTSGITVDQTILKQNGDVVSYDGTNYVTGPTPRWRVVHTDAYTESAVASSSTITFAGGGPTGGIYLKGGDYFAVGSPVRTVISGTTYYGICTAVTDTLLTISGAILPTATAITSLSVGTPDMVKRVTMSFVSTTYNGSSTLVLTKGCQHRWHGATGYLCQYAVAHMNTSATIQVTLQMNGGSDVVATGVIPAAAASSSVYGAFTTSASGVLIAANLAIAHNQTITAKTPVITGLGDYLVINMTFVVP